MVTRRAVAVYVAASFLSMTLFLADYVNTYRAFYPVMVALANSSAFRLMMVNSVIALTLLGWHVMQLIFFGKLNASEEMALLTSFTIYLAECIIVPLYFNLDLMSSTMVFFAFTLVWRLMHKLAAERVTTLSTVQLTVLPVTRMVAYLNFVLIGDVGMLLWLFKSRPELTNEKSSLHYSLLLVYALLVTSSLRSAVRFGSLFVMRGQHTLLPFVADAITSIAESLLFVSVYAYIFMKSTLPLLLLRGFISHALRIFEKASGLAEFLVLARRVRHDMPDATAEDLARDARCTICYEDMVAGGGTKRLPCGHCYHTECLEHWLEGHSTCPYCRANIMRMNSSTTAESAAGADNNNNNDGQAGGVNAAERVGEDGERQGQAQPNNNNEPELQEPLPEDHVADPFAIRRRRHGLEGRLRAQRYRPIIEEMDNMEADLRAAYQRYLDRVDPANSISSSSATDREEERRGAALAAAASAASQDGEDAGQQHRSPLPTMSAQARSSGTPTPPQPSSPLLDTGAAVMAAGVAAAAAAYASAVSSPKAPKTVEQLKLKAYKRYHRRLHEAERELMTALKDAERLSYTA